MQVEGEEDDRHTHQADNDGGQGGRQVHVSFHHNLNKNEKNNLLKLLFTKRAFFLVDPGDKTRSNSKNSNLKKNG